MQDESAHNSVWQHHSMEPEEGIEGPIHKKHDGNLMECKSHAIYSPISMELEPNSLKRLFVQNYMKWPELQKFKVWQSSSHGEGHWTMSLKINF